MAKRKANATEKQGGAAEPADSVQPQTTRPSSPGKVSTPGSRKRSQPVVLPQKPALSPRRAAALNEGDDAVRGAGSPVHSQAKKPAPGSTAAKRVRAADNALAEQTSGSPSRSKPGVEDVATAEPPVKAKRGRPARAPTAKSVATASAPGPVHGTSESPSRSQTAGVDKRAVATEKQPAKTRKRGRPPTLDTKQLGVTGSAGRNMDVPDVTAKNSPKPTKAINRGRTSTAIDTATSESQETEEQSPSAKRAMTSASADGKKTGTAAQGAKRAGRPAKQPNTAGAADEKSRRGAKKLPTTTRTAAPKSPGKQNKKLPASSQMAASSSGAGKNKMAPKGRQQPKPKRGKRKSADDLSDVSNSSDVTPPGWERKTRRSGPFDHVGLWVKSQLAGELDSSDAGDISVASIDSIILPSGMFNRLTGAGGSSEDVDPSLSPREEILSRCEAKFGRDTLPHSTTTTGEAIGMLVHFARMRGLRFGALSELVTIINKMFAPAKDVLPAGKALGMALAQMN
ncbi:hypothetical protein HPB51_008119 [Rhipicephalus microplus]|uniref:Uncharacterized protein n=1 Tax=Rhipicephalus microplus TaxID=6941 RepID=A0A9J6ENY8_RHIMP|nr:hypothetical protein HPB51_008119 [Rhipicephalus microplus]